MKNRLLLGTAVLVVGLLVCTSSAFAQLTYFDAQIVDIESGKTVIPANTTLADGTPFTEMPNPDDANGNWTQNGGTGEDGLWNQRFATPAPGDFGNPDPSGNGTVYESRGQFNGPNSEDPPVLNTTVDVALADQGTEVGVYALFWLDSGVDWQIAASLEFADDELMPLFNGASSNPDYVFEVWDTGDAGAPAGALEMSGLTSTESPGGRRLRAAFLGNVTLGDELSVFVGDGPLGDPIEGDGAHNFRAWYDGIAYGDTQDLEPLPNVPEPASMALLAMALASLGLLRRRR